MKYQIGQDNVFHCVAYRFDTVYVAGLFSLRSVDGTVIATNIGKVSQAGFQWASVGDQVIAGDFKTIAVCLQRFYFVIVVD